jgi:putative transposase
MPVMPSHPYEREHTMTQEKSTSARANLKALMTEDKDFLREIVRETMQQLLEVEMTDTLGAEPGERTESRLGYRAGHYPRTLVTRVGKLELRVPRDRDGRFSTELFERYQRSEKALVSALAEMYVQGVSTRKVKAITEELCGHSFSASAISQINKGLDKSLREFATRRLEEPYPYVILDARYEKVSEGGVIRSQAVFVGIGINQEGYRQVLGVELAGRESQTSWRDFLSSLRDRGLNGVEFVVSDAHEGLRKSLMEMLPEAAWQRCYVRFLRNCLDHLPRKANDDCLQELRWLYDRRNLAEAQKDLSAWLLRWQSTYPKLCDWVEENISETLTFYRLSRGHHKHLKSTNMQLLTEHKREQLRQLEEAA